MLVSQEAIVSEQNFEIKIGDRTLPNREKQSAKAEQQHSESVSSLDKSLLELRTYLSFQVNSHFSGCKTILNALTLKESIETYAKIFEVFETHRAEWQTFCRSLIVIQEQVAGDSDEFKPLFEGELSAWHSELLKGVNFGGTIQTSRVTAELAAQPLGEFKLSLQQEFEQLKKQFVTEMLEMLIELVGLEALGLVEWFGEEACTYSSYVRTCEFEKTGERALNTNFYIELGMWKKRTQVSVELKGKRTLVRRTQHLVEATESKVAESKLIIPREQLGFLKTIPTWISPAIRIVEGMLIRETIAKQDLGVKTFTATEDRVQWHNDPAITLGPFVLSAWGETEIRREEQRQIDAQKDVGSDPENPKDRRWPWNKVTGFTLLLVASLVIQIYPANRFSVLVGFAIGWIAAVILGTQFFVAKDQPVTPVGDDKTSRTIALYAVCGATVLLISTLSNAHGYYFVSVPFVVVSSIFWVLYIKATRGWNVAIAKDE